MEKVSKLVVGVILIVSFALMYTVSLQEAGTQDELAHIPAGYSYVSEFDYRLNPEHPPIVKMMAGFPLLFLDLNFPTDNPAWTDFVSSYKEAFPDGFPSPSLFAHAYYVNTKAALLALDEVGGDLSDGGKKYREALSNLEFDTPTGKVSLDERRNGIADIFLTEVVEGPDGNLVNKTIKVIPQVSQTLGQDVDKFLEYGPVSRENPPC